MGWRSKKNYEYREKIFYPAKVIVFMNQFPNMDTERRSICHPGVVGRSCLPPPLLQSPQLAVRHNCTSQSLEPMSGRMMTTVYAGPWRLL